MALRLPTPGGAVEALLAAPAGPARLTDLVEPARSLTDLSMRRLVQGAASRGDPVPCRKGCCSCCRYLVPVSPPEAMDMADRVERLPQPRRGEVEGRLRRAAEAILRAAPSLAPRPTTEQLSRWYWSLGLDCPLLEEGACSIYPWRPLACREHIIADSPADCAREQSPQVPLAPPVSLALALCRAAAVLEGTEPQSVLLPLALLWARSHAPRRHRTYPAAALAEALARAMETASPLAA